MQKNYISSIIFLIGLLLLSSFFEFQLNDSFNLELFAFLLSVSIGYVIFSFGLIRAIVVNSKEVYNIRVDLYDVFKENDKTAKWIEKKVIEKEKEEWIMDIYTKLKYNSNYSEKFRKKIGDIDDFTRLFCSEKIDDFLNDADLKLKQKIILKKFHKNLNDTNSYEIRYIRSQYETADLIRKDYRSIFENFFTIAGFVGMIIGFIGINSFINQGIGNYIFLFIALIVSLINDYFVFKNLKYMYIVDYSNQLNLIYNILEAKNTEN